LAYVPVLAAKTVPSCKLCKHPRRAEIDALLEKRSNKIRDPKTKQLLFTAEILKKRFAEEFGVVNPTDENLQVHWKKHCEVVTQAEVNEVEDALSELNQEMLDIIDGSDGTVDNDLRVVFKLGMKRIRGRVLRGEDPGVSVDHALKASAELTKRQDNEAKHELLQALTGGIATALSAPRQPLPIEGAEVIEVEVVEE
jgi:hypothetical protein